MKQLIRRLTRVAESSTQYYLLRSEQAKRRTRRSASGVPEGHLPVYVGEEEMERFVVSARFLNHPVFAELLKRSAQEYGYEQEGVLRIPCRVVVFERILELLKKGKAEEEIVRLFSEDFV
ncbi:auxin-responsive protein SAUR71 [Cinnamomum micranthum f. kanehirae]|uniref:Auxin-responsive protein SAUR71 n=1 Tax=Cinnamomum micranthum f. kanehirae TaxID=337451 RepID=A0A3S3MRZ6_9MAGN|nr:auxin-responsive protein SAUR71 [Cinnamomum micranthum f. kanehirae]